MQDLLVFLHPNRTEDGLRIAVPCRAVFQRIQTVHDAGVFVRDDNSDEESQLDNLYGF